MNTRGKNFLYSDENTLVLFFYSYLENFLKLKIYFHNSYLRTYYLLQPLSSATNLGKKVFKNISDILGNLVLTQNSLVQHLFKFLP